MKTAADIEIDAYLDRMAKPPEIAEPQTPASAPPVTQTPPVQVSAPAEESVACYVPSPVIVCMADVEARPIQWLWQHRLPRGRLTLLVGMPGCGKSFFTLDAAARVSTGSPWPDGAVCQRGTALIISAEDDPHDTIRPRLDAAGADVHRVHILKATRYRDEKGLSHECCFTLADVGSLEDAMRRLRPALTVIDPIGSYMGSGADAHRDNEVRGVLSPVAALAERYECAVLIVAHRRKSSGTIADDLALGSRAFTGICRGVWHIMSDPDSRTRRLLLPGKMNLSRQALGLAFSITGEPPRACWEKLPVDMTADELLAQESRPGPEPEARNAAMEWLKGKLADLAEHPVKALKEAAKEEGVNWRTIERAKAGMRIISHRGTYGGGFIWRLPKPGVNGESLSRQT